MAVFASKLLPAQCRHLTASAAGRRDPAWDFLETREPLLLQQPLPPPPHNLSVPYHSDQPFAVPQVALLSAHLRSHGLHPPGQAAQAQGVQVLWSRPQFGIALCHEAVLFEFCDSLFSHVDGVSFPFSHGSYSFIVLEPNADLFPDPTS